MNFKQMKMIESELTRLERSAQHAGQHGADWWSVLLAVNEPLSKCCGSDASHERLRTATAYEVARAGLFAAWAQGEKQASTAAPVDASGQTSFLDTSEAYH